MVSNGESCYAPSVLSGSLRTPTEDSSAVSPSRGYFERCERSPGFSVSPRDSSAPPAIPPMRTDPTCMDGLRYDSLASSRHLPSLSDMFDGRPVLNGPSYSSEQQPGPNPGLLPRGFQTASPAHTPSTSCSESRPPSLKKEQSSAGSLSSGSSYSSYPRTPIEGPLPIHALLTNVKQYGPPDMTHTNKPTIYRSMSPDDRGLSAQYPQEAAPCEPNAARQAMPHNNGELMSRISCSIGSHGIDAMTTTGYYPGHPSVPNHTSNTPLPRYQFGYQESRQAVVPAQPPIEEPTPGSAAGPAGPVGRPAAGLDGISALLQADKFVDRR